MIFWCILCSKLSQHQAACTCVCFCFLLKMNAFLQSRFLCFSFLGCWYYWRRYEWFEHKNPWWKWSKGSVLERGSKCKVQRSTWLKVSFSLHFSIPNLRFKSHWTDCREHQWQKWLLSESFGNLYRRYLANLGELVYMMIPWMATKNIYKK